MRWTCCSRVGELVLALEALCSHQRPRRRGDVALAMAGAAAGEATMAGPFVVVQMTAARVYREMVELQDIPS
jgi:hypothetical protein